MKKYFLILKSCILFVLCFYCDSAEAELYYVKDTGITAEQFLALPGKQLKYKHNNMLDLNVSTDYNWILPDKQLLSTPGNYILACKESFLDYVEFWYKDKHGQWKCIKNGSSVPLAKRKFFNPVIAFSLDSLDESHTMALRIKANGPVIPIDIYETSDFWRNEIKNGMLTWLMTGILILILIINLSNCVFKFNINYLLYSILVIIYILTQLVVRSHISLIFPSFLPYCFRIIIINGICTNLMIVIYTISFLNLWQKSKPWFWYCIGLGGLHIGILLVSFFVSNTQLLFGTFTATLFVFCIPLIGFICYRKERRTSTLFFACAYVCFVIGILLEVTHLSFALDYIWDIPYMNIGIFFESIILSVSLTQRASEETNVLRMEKAQAQQEAYSQLLRNQEIIQNQNEQLEEMVRFRTCELEEKQNEILAQNEELTQQGDMLREQKDYIELINEQLNQDQKALEGKIQQRTKELEEKNTELIKQNSQLEQFSYIAAHNLRGPVARLIGLATIFDKENLTNPQNIIVIDNIKLSANQVDQVISDITTILDTRKGLTPEVVNIEDELQEACEMLSTEIMDNDASIILDFSAGKYVMGERTFVKSTLYNLISNAIKYRSVQKPVIQIQTYMEDNMLYLSVKDNGIGIDLDLYGNKIFKLYQRFNPEKEGKGMGLFISKIQVEAMHGSMRIDSKKEEGTTIIIGLQVAV